MSDKISKQNAALALIDGRGLETFAGPAVATALLAAAREKAAKQVLGDGPRWHTAIAALERHALERREGGGRGAASGVASGAASRAANSAVAWRGDVAAPRLGPGAGAVSPTYGVASPGVASSHDAIKALLLELSPWRKGPFEVLGVALDAEWRCDYKWSRVMNAVSVAGKTVLDVGSGSGYYLLRALGAGARAALGIDPTWLYVAQFAALRRVTAPLGDAAPLGEPARLGETASFDLARRGETASFGPARLGETASFESVRRGETASFESAPRGETASFDPAPLGVTAPSAGAASLPAWVLPLALEDLRTPHLPVADVVFSMGVLYHRKSPIEHLEALRDVVRPGGTLVLETLVVPGDERTVLVPQARYAAMRNVWMLPSVDAACAWLRRCGYVDIRVADVTPTSPAEQRATEFMTSASLPEFLDPNDPTLTIEGYPAPTRALIVARRR